MIKAFVQFLQFWRKHTHLSLPQNSNLLDSGILKGVGYLKKCSFIGKWWYLLLIWIWIWVLEPLPS